MTTKPPNIFTLANIVAKKPVSEDVSEINVSKDLDSSRTTKDQLPIIIIPEIAFVTLISGV